LGKDEACLPYFSPLEEEKKIRAGRTNEKKRLRGKKKVTGEGKGGRKRGGKGRGPAIKSLRVEVKGRKNREKNLPKMEGRRGGQLQRL